MQPLFLQTSASWPGHTYQTQVDLIVATHEHTTNDKTSRIASSLQQQRLHLRIKVMFELYNRQQGSTNLKHKLKKQTYEFAICKLA